MREHADLESRLGDGVQGGDAGDRVVAELLDAQQAPVGLKADLPQCGQIRQSFAAPQHQDHAPSADATSTASQHPNLSLVTVNGSL